MNLCGYRTYYNRGYKYFGEGGYTIILKMKYNDEPPIKLPEKITKEELDKVRPMFDIVEEYPRGGLFV
jgi:hypothetical protein